MRIYWIDKIPNHKLGMMARPRGNDWLYDDIKKLSLHDVGVVISLLEPTEIRELGLNNEGEHCESVGIHFINYPIEDRSLPHSQSTFNELIDTLSQKLSAGKKVVVHCRMGIGRTSMVCAALLIRNGVDPKEVFDILSETRTFQVPDTPEQAQWVHDFVTGQ
ncbi:MAG: tyrosine protein phosphatase [Roseivirga sp.]|nr:tyrosine protein phosphatase [Roseivirga sp.]